MEQANSGVKSEITPKIVIIGGGFAGVRCALDCAKKHSDWSILLVSKEKEFTYYPAMYRFVHGAARAHVAIDFDTIFKSYKNVVVAQDTIVDIDPAQKIATGDSGMIYRAEDAMVVAMGSDTNYFHIEGVGEYSFNFKSLDAAATLRDRVAELFSRHVGCDTAEMLVEIGRAHV